MFRLNCRVLISAAALVMLPTMVGAAFPDHVVHLVYPFDPGGGGDSLSRLVAAKLSKKWGQPVVVDNKAGADGDIAADYVARARPDGYTFMHISNDFTVAPSLRKLNFDPVKSITGITMLISHPDLFMTNPSVVSAATLKDFIDVAKAKPGQLNFGSAGQGSPPFMFMQMFMQKAGFHAVTVNYKGNGPAMLALVGGEVQSAFTSPADVQQQIQSGKLRALGVTTKARIPTLPNVPSIAEAAGIPDFDESAFNGFVAPAGVPKGILNKIRDDLAEVINEPDLRDRYLSQGYTIVTSKPDEFTKFLSDDIANWASVLKSINLK